jgi:hypothetical protein
MLNQGWRFRREIGNRMIGIDGPAISAQSLHRIAAYCRCHCRRENAAPSAWDAGRIKETKTTRVWTRVRGAVLVPASVA